MFELTKECKSLIMKSSPKLC